MSSVKPLVTLYILNFNYGKFLRQCVDSVLSQTYKNIEIIVIDDGSKDDSLDILDEYTEKNILIVSQKNIGLIKSISKAFDISKGKYVVRVDADDWIESDFVECLVNEIEKNTEVAMVFPDYYEVNEQGSILHRIRRHDFTSDVTLLDQPAHGACTLTRRDAYFDVGGHNQNIECQDGVDIWLSVTNRYKVSNYKKPLFYYRKHDSSITNDSEKTLHNRSIIFRDHALKRGYIKDTVVAFIPVRSQLFNGKEFVLELVGNRTLLDITINKAIMSTEVTRIVVSTDSLIVYSYVKDKYSGIDINLEVHIRADILVQKGVHINLSIKDYFLSKDKSNISALVVLTPHSPFSSYQYVDTAVFSSFLFGTNIVDSVIEDASIIYYHDGNGMKKIHEGDIRYERDYVYIRKGGVTFYSKDAINNLIEKKINYNGVGHVLITSKASLEVIDKYSLHMANYILKEDNLII